MIDVVIYETEMEISFETKIPKIPERSDKIGAWLDGVWYICEIHSIIYEFKQNGDFERVEIGIIAR